MMLKKLRGRFIGSAMASVFTVMMILLAAINVINYSRVTSRRDMTLSLIMDYELKGGAPPGAIPFPRDGEFRGFSPEAPFSTRFFSVLFDTHGNIIEIKRDFIGSVSESEAAAYASDVLRSTRTSGYYGDYRFAVKSVSEGKNLIFLHSASELQMIRSLLWTSCIVAACSLLATFLLVLIFSKRAISPYIRNLEAQKRFITDAGHEIKTPLTSIAASADVLASEHEHNEWIENIQKQSARLSKLVGNLVALSRLDEAAPFPEKTEFSLSDAAWETSEPFSSMAKAGGRRYVQDIQDDLTMTGDKASIQQMMSVLLDNALRYSSSGGDIRFSVYGKHRDLIIEVINTCEIQDVKNLDRLFDRFYRLDKSRSASSGGTGIGLSIAKATAEGHGGRISAVRVNDETIMFKVIL